VFFVRTLVFGVVDEREVETGFKPVSTHVMNYGSPKSVNKTHHEPNTLGFGIPTREKPKQNMILKIKKS